MTFENVRSEFGNRGVGEARKLIRESSADTSYGFGRSASRHAASLPDSKTGSAGEVRAEEV